MKKEVKEKKLCLGKVTIQDFETHLDNDDQKTIKGGADNVQYVGTTNMPIYCRP
jgi:hypothetical protein